MRLSTLSVIWMFDVQLRKGFASGRSVWTGNVVSMAGSGWRFIGSESWEKFHCWCLTRQSICLSHSFLVAAVSFIFNHFSPPPIHAQQICHWTKSQPDKFQYAQPTVDVIPNPICRNLLTVPFSCNNRCRRQCDKHTTPERNPLRATAGRYDTQLTGWPSVAPHKFVINLINWNRNNNGIENNKKI